MSEAAKLHGRTTMVDSGFPAMLHIQLLGGFRVSVGSRSIEEDAWRLRKAASLVKLLALTPSHRLHREQVLDLLWPDLDPKAAANNLHHALHVVRRLLSPEGASPYLRFQGDLLTLAPDHALWVDVEALQASAADARRSRDPADYRSALALYHGDLLPEDLYEDWAADRREGLRSLFHSLLLELAGICEGESQLGAAIEALQRAVSSDSTLEEAHAGLMRLYARAGQRHQALRQYEQLHHALQEELDAEPEEATRELYQAIRAGKIPTASQRATPWTLRGFLEAPPAAPRRHNLPAALTSFVGREREMAELERLLLGGDLGEAQPSRLLTVTGAGGAGKTRLALETVRTLVDDRSTIGERRRSTTGERRHPDGIWLVELASLSDPALVPHTVASALEIPEQPGRDPLQSLVDVLQSKQLLLVLDNCEHLIGACAELAETLLRSCPQLQILATSREPLRIEGEVTALIPPLSLPTEYQRVDLPLYDRRMPASVDALLSSDSIRLFVERAQNRQPTFRLTEQNARAVVEICRQLDGMPLAIELAAARMGALSVEHIAGRLQNALGFLTAGSRTALSRQQTLRGTLDWSYRLLDETERMLFTRLSVFAGGWNLEAAEAIGANEEGDAEGVLDLLSLLVDKSLVEAEGRRDGSIRYRLLEPVRQYARERLDVSSEQEPVQRRHADFFLALAEQARPLLSGPELASWLDRLETEHDNLRAALQWYSSEEGDAGKALQLAGQLWPFWSVRHPQEGASWLRAVLTRPASRPSEGSGSFEAGDDGGPAIDERLSGAVAEALQGAALIAHWQRDYERAASCSEQALEIYRRLDDLQGAAACLNTLGLVAMEREELQRAIGLYEEALELYRMAGDRYGMAESLANLGCITNELGDLDRALAVSEEALALFREIGSPLMIAAAVANVGATARELGESRRALECFGEALRINHELGDQRQTAFCLEGIALTLYREDKAEQATELLGAAEALRERCGQPIEAHLEKWYEPYRGKLKAALGEEAFRARWAAGQAMTPEQAVEYALSTMEEPSLSDQPMLTRREREIAELVAQGLSNRQIADELVISERTVDTHVGNILSKLGLSSRTQVAIQLTGEKSTL